MQKKFIAGVFYASSLMAVIAIPQSPQAKEPHSAKAHTYEESVYKNGPVMTLPEAIKRAIEASPRMRSAAAGLGAAKGAENQAGYFPNPVFEFDAENVAGSGRFGGVDGAEVTYKLTQEMEISGQRTHRMKAAGYGVAISEYELTIKRLDLTRDVQVAYADAIAAQKILTLAGERKALAQKMLATVKKRVQAAREPEVQLRKAEITLSTANVVLERAAREFQHTKHVLSSLWAGHDEDYLLEDEHFYELVVTPTEMAVEEGLKNTPDMKRWNAESDSRKALYKLKKAKATPNPRLSFGVRDLRESGDQAFVAGVSIPIPIFNRNKGNIISAESEMLKAESDGHVTHISLQNTVFQWLEEMKNAYSHARTLKADIIPTAQQAFDLSSEGYRSGKFPYLEVLDAQRTLFEVKEQYIAVLKEYQMARANVERLTTPAEVKENEGDK